MNSTHRDASLDFSTRWNGTELMDDPACDESKLLRTVAQFTIINRLLTRYRHVLASSVFRDMRRQPAKWYHLIDAGCGGGDIAAWLVRAAKRRNLRLCVTGIDSDPRIIAWANEKQGPTEGLSFEVGNVLDEAVYANADYIYMQHVLHHLPDTLIPGTLSTLHHQARRGWIVNDLLRSRASYAAFHLVGPWFRKSFIFEDGKRSIRKAFRIRELHAFLHAAGVGQATVSRLIPGRLIITGGSWLDKSNTDRY